MFYFVSKDKNYLWIGILLSIFALQGLAFSSSSYFGFRFNYMFGPIGFTIVSAIIIQFLRNILMFHDKNKKIDKIYIWFIRFYLILMLVYVYDSFYYPDSEIYKNLIKYPYPQFGVGTIPVYFSFIPVVIIVISSIYFSAKMWLNKDKAAGYLLITFMIPFFSGFLFILAYLFSDRYHSDFFIKQIINSIPGFSLLFLPTTLGLALAERVNQFKKKTIDLLEDKVKVRTSELTEANQLITQSINSASIIQNSILPKIDCEKYGFNEFEYLWEPRDIVGGDFYWVGKKSDWTCLVVADCTGHGIPGAFMTLISTTLLNRVKEIVNLSQPDQILDSLDFLLEETLKFDENTGTEFGLDGGVCCFSQKENLLRFAGAKMNLYYKAANEIFELKGNKKSLGYVTKPHPQSFDVHDVSLTSSPTFYLFSDGLTDQVGGPKKIMYGKKRIIRKIGEISDLNLTIQNISQDFNQYQGENKRRDDISLFGFRVGNQVETV